METIPKGIRGDLTTRQWKSLKRKQLLVIKKAFTEYRLGCAFCPGYDSNVTEIDVNLDQMIQRHSVKNWGR